MNTQNLENQNDFSIETFRAFLSTSSQLFMECSDEVQVVVRDMFAVITNPDASPAEKQRACSTIAHALHPHETKRAPIAQRLDQMDSQESSFADRLRELLQKRNITQQELAARADCTQSAISKMLTRNCRPQKKTIFKLAAALGVEPIELWPDLEVAAILDSVAQFQQSQQLTKEQADAIEEASKRPPSKTKGRRLPSRKGK